MTDRYNTLTVVLDRDIRSDDAESLIEAIRMLKGVSDVKGDVSDVTSYMAYTRAKRELETKLWQVLYPDGIRPKWIEARKQQPRKDAPILVLSEFSEMPDVVLWQQEGTYGKPGFFESNNEYEIKEETITFWMLAPKSPYK